jgi:cob(I)alamin adenosyltransferase
MKIYTKKGDKGETGLADGKRFSKSEEIFWVMGEIDELCAWMGVIQEKILSNTNQYYPILTNINKKVRGQKKMIKGEEEICENLHRICVNLFTVNSILARAKNIKFDSEKETIWLEKEIDEMTAELPELRNFILPGGSEISANLHIARAICRRVERRLVNQCEITRSEFLPFFNRLSDYLFTLARFVNFKMRVKEEIWKG